MSLPRVPILELDADLVEAVPELQRAVATRFATAPLLQLPVGPWPEPAADLQVGTLGLLVLDGLLTRAVTVGGRTTCELIGEGDLLRPWDHDSGGVHVQLDWHWAVLEPARVAVLDERFAQVVARWPRLLELLIGRAVRRSRNLALQLTLTQVKRVEERLALLLWTLAERWGRVGPDGVVVPVRLTHETLALLIGARRPTVTTALGALTRAGRVTRHEQGWLLHGPGPDVRSLTFTRSDARGEVLSVGHEPKGSSAS